MPNILVKTPHGNVSTDEAGAAVLGQTMDAAAEDQKKLKETTDQFDGLNEKIVKMKELEEKIAELTAERDQYKGEVDAVKVQLEQITSPEAIQAMVSETAETQETAESLSQDGTIDALPANWKTLPVKELQKLVVGGYMSKTGQTMDAKAVTDDYVKGVWSVLKKSIKETGKNVPVAGAWTQDQKSMPRLTKEQRLGYKPIKKAS